MDKRLVPLCQSPLLSVRLRRLRSRSVTAQSGPCRRASVTQGGQSARRDGIERREEIQQRFIALQADLVQAHGVDDPASVGVAQGGAGKRAARHIGTDGVQHHLLAVQLAPDHHVSGRYPVQSERTRAHLDLRILPSTLPASGCHGLTPPVTFARLNPTPCWGC